MLKSVKADIPDLAICQNYRDLTALFSSNLDG